MQLLENFQTSTQPKPLTVRIARWSARHCWTVFTLWFIFTLGLFMAGNLWGTRLRTLTNLSDAYPDLEAGKAWAVFQADGGLSAPQSLVIVISHPSLKANDQAYEKVVIELAGLLRAATYYENGQAVPVFAQVADYYATNLPYLASPDGSTTRIIATLNGDPKDQAKKLEPVMVKLKNLKKEHKEFEIKALNSALLLNDLIELMQKDLDGSLVITLPASFVILLIAFGTVIAAFVPLVLAMSALLAAFGALAVYSQLVTPVDFSTSEVIGLIGLAVGIDYSLFMITRYRTERRHGRDRLSAIEIASGTAGRAVFFSGLIVMISLAGLLLMGDSSYNAMAVGTIAVVLASVIGSLTFLPATLSILGNGVNWGRIPFFGRDREEGRGIWATIVRKVMRRPLAFMLVTLAALLTLSLPMLNLNLGTNGIDSYPGSLEGIRAAQLMDKKWPEGSNLKLYVFVTNADRPETKTALAKLQTAAVQIKGLSAAPESATSGGGKVSYISFYVAGSPNSQVNKALVNKLRTELVPAYFGSLKDVQVYISGDPAFTVDIIKLYADKTPLVIGFVLALSFGLLLLAFRSLVIPIKAIFLNFLSLGASYGVLVLVFQQGWLSQPLDFQPSGIIEAFIPLFMFTILFGLSMDYHLFILTRIKEARDQGLNSNEAVAQGISVTSGTITSAAAIMVVVFGFFVTLQLISVKQLGLGLAVAVLLDATIIRSILLPATMRLLGNWNWWLPNFLNWLPRVTIEAAAQDEALSHSNILAREKQRSR
jgi:uncharacterized membrane protein YdfJ with MMPL/SSD domain